MHDKTQSGDLVAEDAFTLSAMKIVIAAVGGQGALTAARVLGHFAIHHGFDVKISELHGMSQRGGSVVTHVTFANQVYSPVVEKGTADVVVAFEQLEGARYAAYAKPGGLLVLNTQKISPMPVLFGAAKYPSQLPQALASLGLRVKALDARTIAFELGNPRVVNTVMLGALAKACEWPRSQFEKSVRISVPKRFVNENIEAFNSGYESLSGGLT